ncbi:MAG: T9SS type A sorting domain-containing protein [Candidatus Marinimicrobia bacterium]|nr:T9SS type A sorting domain-containing protein [Candidatus Neomarinimicrobiota bacterium]
MSRKMLTIVGIVLALTWSLTAADKSSNYVGNGNSHVERANAEQIVTGESDALISGSTVYRPSHNTSYSRNTADTMFYDMPYGGQFIQSPGDAMITAFQMPADGILKGVNVPVYEWGTGDQQLTISLHELTFPNGADGTPLPSTAVNGAGWIGGYDLDANGYVTISGTTYTPGGTAGACTDPPTNVAANAADPLGAVDGAGPPGPPPQGLLWPDGFTAATLTPATHPDISIDGGGDNWVATGDFGTEPVVTAGSWVGVFVSSTGAGGGDDDATGFLYADGTGQFDPWVSMKFYTECSGTSGNGGWHIRSWVFGFEVAVELTGDRAPVINSYTQLYTTLSNDAREVTANITDDNPSGGDAGVASAVLSYSVDGGNDVDITMTAAGDDYTATIPGQAAGTAVVYSIVATDVLGNVSNPSGGSYTIFAPIENRLFFWNTGDMSLGTGALYYLYGTDIAFDAWDGVNYGAGSDALFDLYVGIVEMTGSGPSVINNEFARTFVEAGGNYVLAGDEWLGAQSGWTDTDYVAGDFQYDILGIDADHNDISGTATGISRLMTVDGDAISGALHSFLADSLLLNYDPNYEVGISNWLDGVTPVAGVSVAFNALDGVLDANGDPTGTTEYATGIYSTHTSGGKVVFLGFDPVSLNTQPGYHWIGIDPIGSGNAAIEWSMALGVENNSQLPSEFALHGNYPNPFNPSTKISFTMSTMSNVNVKVFSLLGAEIATIQNGVLNAGTHDVSWNGLDHSGNAVASGMYIYQVENGNNTYSGKMMLLK